MDSSGDFQSQVGPQFDDLEIVGFDGIVLPEVHCDASLPVVRKKSTDIYLILRSNYSLDKAINTFTRSELEEYEREGRITLFARAIPAFADAVVVYVSHELIDKSGYKQQEPFDGRKIEWAELDNSTLVCCIPEKTSRNLLNTWAGLLLNVADDLLMRDLLKNAKVNTVEIEHICEMALDAARDAGITERAFLRLGVALFYSDAVERLMKLYPIILKTFPNWTKPVFLQQVTDMTELLRAKARLRSPIQEDKSLQEGYLLSPLSKLAVDLAMRVNKLSDFSVQGEAVEVAELFRNVREDEIASEADALDAFVQRIRDSSYLYLDDDGIKLLATKSFFYLPGVVSLGENQRPVLSVHALLDAYNDGGGAAEETAKETVEETSKEPVKQDPISEYALSGED